MDAKNLFDAIAYFTELTETNRLAIANGFYPCQCSGLGSLQGVLEQFQKKSNFVCIDDTADGRTYRRNSAGFYKRRTFTVYIMAKYTWDDMADRQTKLTLCRQLFRQFHSRMLVDEHKLDNELIYLEVGDIMSREFGQYFVSGLTGLYFMVNVSEPVDITYDSDEWTEE